MKLIKNESGVALITALMLTLITLAMCMTLLYLVMQGTKSSAAAKAYRTSLEASYGGVEVVSKDIIPILFGNISTATRVSEIKNGFSAINLDVLLSNNCINQKLGQSVAGWNACTADQKSSNLALVRTAPDFTFLLRGLAGQPSFKVYSKIVDTSPGNTDPAASGSTSKFGDEKLIVAAGAAYNSAGSGGGGAGGGVKVMHIPALFKMEVQGEREVNPQEKSNLTVLYAF